MIRRAALILFVLGALALSYAVWRADPIGLARAIRTDAPVKVASESAVQITVPQGASADQIVDALEVGGAVHDASILRLLLRFLGGGDQLQAGRYQFPRDADPAVALRILRGGPNSQRMITVREGLRVEEVGALFVEQGIVTPAQWSAAITAPRTEAFLANRPEGATLTGYLFPATYDVVRYSTADLLVQAMLATFQEQVSPATVTKAKALGMTLHEAITLASIVEREAQAPDERALIAAVFHNRLEAGIQLQADPTVQFGLTVDPVNGPSSVATYGYWKKGLTAADLALRSPYNTYLNRGLPPGPIANPGLGAIEATVNPAPVPYLYFVAAPSCDGRHLFASDLDAHNRNVALFRASPCAR